MHQAAYSNDPLVYAEREAGVAKLQASIEALARFTSPDDAKPIELFDVGVARWGFVAKTLIDSRNWLLSLASEDSGRVDTPAQKECYRRAARALGPAISEAVNEQAAHRAKQHSGDSLSEAQRCVRFCEGYLEWLDEINSDSAFADDPARLGSDVPFDLEKRDE